MSTEASYRLVIVARPFYRLLGERYYTDEEGGDLDVGDVVTAEDLRTDGDGDLSVRAEDGALHAVSWECIARSQRAEAKAPEIPDNPASTSTATMTAHAGLAEWERRLIATAPSPLVCQCAVCRGDAS